MQDVLDIERQMELQFEAEDADHQYDAKSVAGTEDTESVMQDGQPSVGGENFHSSKKSNTLKKYYKKMFKKTKTQELPEVAGANAQTHMPQGPSAAPTISGPSARSSQADDLSEVTSEMGRGSRMSTRYDLGILDGEDTANHKNSLKNFLKGKKKKNKQIELDAIRQVNGTHLWMALQLNLNIPSCYPHH